MKPADASRPRVLVLVDWYEPGSRGGGLIRSCARLVRALSDRIDFSVVTRDTDFGAGAPYPGIEPDRWIERDGFRVYYFSKAALRPRALRALIEAERPDTLYLNSVFSRAFALWPLARVPWRRPPFRTVLAPRGMIQPGALQIKPFRKRVWLLLGRALGLHRGVVFHATSEDEARDVRRVFGAAVPVVVAPELLDPHLPPWSPARKAAGELRLAFLSRISRKKNLDYLIARLGACRSRIALDVFGPAEDPRYLAECREAAAALPSNVSVEWNGEIAPDAVREALAPSHVFALPTRGENFGHVLAEALAAGKPVLTSDRTPWRGLEALRAGWDLPLERPEAFVEAIERAAAMGPEEYETWSRGAYEAARRAAADPAPRRTALALFGAPPDPA